jgi:hypothetical protein
MCLSLRRSPDVLGRYCFSGDLFGMFVGHRGVLVGLSGEFMGGKMISLAVSGRGGNVGVGRKVVKFSASIVSALWQCESPIYGVPLNAHDECNGGALESCGGPQYGRCIALDERKRAVLKAFPGFGSVTRQ